MSCPVCGSNSYSRVIMPMGNILNFVEEDIMVKGYMGNDLGCCQFCNTIYTLSEEEEIIPPPLTHYCKDCEYCDLILGDGNIIGIYSCVNPESDHDQHLFLNGHKACSLFKQKEK